MELSAADRIFYRLLLVVLVLCSIYFLLEFYSLNHKPDLALHSAELDSKVNSEMKEFQANGLITSIKFQDHIAIIQVGPRFFCDGQIRRKLNDSDTIFHIACWFNWMKDQHGDCTDLLIIDIQNRTVGRYTAESGWQGAIAFQ